MKNIFLILMSALLMSGCGGSDGGGSTTTPTVIGSAKDLTIYAPQVVPVLQSSVTNSIANTATGMNSSILIKNNSSSAVTGISYAISGTVGDGSQVTLEGNQCASIDANSSCTITVTTPTTATGGSFTVSATNQNGSSLTRATGIERIVQNSESGIDGVQVFYYDTVSSGDKFAVLTGIVSSANASRFNTVEILSSDGSYIDGQMSLSSNLGNNKTKLTLGATFEILVPVPQNLGVQAFKYRLSYVEKNQVLEQLTSDSRTVDISAYGVLDALNSKILFTNSVRAQTITLSNMSNKAVAVKSITNNDNNIEIVDFTPNKAVPAHGYLTINVRLKTLKPITDSGIIITYNNGVNDVPIIVQVSLNAILPITPVPGLGFDMNSYEFYTTTVIGSVSNQLILTNTGNTLESGFTFNLPAGFSIAQSSSTSLANCTISGNMVTNSLDSLDSCQLNLVYTNSTAVPQSTANITVDYTYSNNQNATGNLAVSYRVTQSSANINISPTSYAFASILADGVQSQTTSFRVTNLGEATATNLTSLIESSNVFSISNASTCVNSLNAGDFCAIVVQFGPTTESGTKLANLKVSYNNATEVTDLNIPLSGTVMPLQSALFDVAITSTSGFTQGTSGTESNPYEVEQDKSGSVTYTITNNGNNAANNFSVSQLSLPSNVTRTGYTCGSVLNVGASCNVTYTVNSPTPVTFTANQANLIVNWSDQANPSGTSLALPSQLIYVEVYRTPTITVTSSVAIDEQNQITVNKGSDFTLTFNLQGGYLVSTRVSLNNVDGFNYPNGNSCDITSASPSCTIQVHVASNATVGTKVLTPTTNNNIVVTPNSINVVVNNSVAIATWVSGSNTQDVQTVYGTKGVTSSSNTIGSRIGNSWASSGDIQYSYGGKRHLIHSDFQNPAFADLWAYNSLTKEWTWIAGESTLDVHAVFGERGVESAGNHPGSIGSGALMIYSNGYLYLYGGSGYVETGGIVDLSNMWRYNLSSGQWAYLSGSKDGDQNAVFGTQGVSSDLVTPGSIDNGELWVDTNGNIWAYGGLDANPTTANAAMWKFDITSNQWTWMSGSSAIIENYSNPVYGTKGIASITNTPGTRDDFVAWSDKSGGLWLYGGNTAPIFNGDAYEDVWKYDTNSNMWTWVGGSSKSSTSGNYGELGVASPTNLPPGRFTECATSNIGDGTKVYMYGGAEYSAGGGYGDMYNDLWEYDMTTNMWTWLAGAKGAQNQVAVFGQKGVPSTSNIVGGLAECQMSLLSDRTTLNISGGLYCANGMSQTTCRKTAGFDAVWQIKLP